MYTNVYIKRVAISVIGKKKWLRPQRVKKHNQLFSAAVVKICQRGELITNPESLFCLCNGIVFLNQSRGQGNCAFYDE